MSDFLSPPQYLPRLLPADIDVLTARFDVSRFDPSLYAEHGIGFSDKLQGAVVKRQAEYLAGRILADRLLQSRGHPPHDLQPGEHRCPQWPAGLTGSISHTKNTAVCALAADSDYGGVGVDVEPLDSTSRVVSVTRLFVDEQEQSRVTASPIDDALLLIAIFSAKESLFKALYPGVGRWFGFQAARFTSAQSPSEADAPYTERFALTLALTDSLADHCPADAQYRLEVATTDELIVTALAIPPLPGSHTGQS